MARKNVSASTVREWFAGLTPAQQDAIKAPGTRGRLHPDTLAAFHKANKGMRYETASEAEKPTITVPVVMLDKAGRKTTREVTVTTEYARTLLGHTKGKRGRFDKGLLSLALEAERLTNA